MTDTPEFETNATTATLPPPAPTPVQPARKSGNGWTVFFAVVATALFGLFVALIGVIAVGTVFVAAVASGELDIETDKVEIDLAPTSIEAIPTVINEEAAEIEIDLTKIDVAEFQNADAPVELDVSADFGSITVIIPEGLNVEVDASNDLGDVTVLGDSNDGFSNTLVRTTDDPDAVLDLHLDVGKIEVVQG